MIRVVSKHACKVGRVSFQVHDFDEKLDLCHPFAVVPPSDEEAKDAVRRIFPPHSSSLSSSSRISSSSNIAQMVVNSDVLAMGVEISQIPDVWDAIRNSHEAQRVFQEYVEKSNNGEQPGSLQQQYIHSNSDNNNNVKRRAGSSFDELISNSEIDENGFQPGEDHGSRNLRHNFPQNQPQAPQCESSLPRFLRAALEWLWRHLVSSFSDESERMQENGDEKISSVTDDGDRSRSQLPLNVDRHRRNVQAHYHYMHGSGSDEGQHTHPLCSEGDDCRGNCQRQNDAQSNKDSYSASVQQKAAVAIATIIMITVVSLRMLNGRC